MSANIVIGKLSQNVANVYRTHFQCSWSRSHSTQDLRNLKKVCGYRSFPHKPSTDGLEILPTEIHALHFGRAFNLMPHP